MTNKTLTNASGPLVLGVRRGGASASLNGYLDEVAIYSSALSASGVAAHYAAAAGYKDANAQLVEIDKLIAQRNRWYTQPTPYSATNAAT